MEEKYLKIEKGDLICGIIMAILLIIIAILTTDSINKEKITSQAKEITELKEQVEVLEKENKELEEKYLFEKQQAEYWYFFNVNDCC